LILCTFRFFCAFKLSKKVAHELPALLRTGQVFDSNEYRSLRDEAYDRFGYIPVVFLFLVLSVRLVLMVRRRAFLSRR
jgi:hypothetical protein